MKGLLGFETTVTVIQAAYKLSQNRDDTNHGTIVEALEKGGGVQEMGVAEYMRLFENR